MEYNLAQRVHLNFVEQLQMVLFLLVAGGLLYPVVFTILGVLYSISRFGYWFHYS